MFIFILIDYNQEKNKHFLAIDETESADYTIFLHYFLWFEIFFLLKFQRADLRFDLLVDHLLIFL